MGFKEDATAFKRTLPLLAELSTAVLNIDQAPKLMEEAVELKKLLDKSNPASPACRYDEIKEALAKLAAIAQVDGFRHGQIAFTAMKRMTLHGDTYIVKAIEVLPDETDPVIISQ